MNMQGLLKQAQQMQNNLNHLEKELAQTQYTGMAENGKVKVTVSGAYEIQNVFIDTEVLHAKNGTALCELFRVAANQALASAKLDHEEKTAAITQGVKLPGGF